MNHEQKWKSNKSNFDSKLCRTDLNVS